METTSHKIKVARFYPRHGAVIVTDTKKHNVFTQVVMFGLADVATMMVVMSLRWLAVLALVLFFCGLPFFSDYTCDRTTIERVSSIEYVLGRCLLSNPSFSPIGEVMHAFIPNLSG